MEKTNIETQPHSDREFYGKVDKMMEEILSPSKYYGIECVAKSIHDKEGVQYRNVTINWYVAGRSEEDLLKRIRLINGHKLAKPPVPEKQNLPEGYDYRPDCISEKFDKKELEVVKKVLDGCDNILSVQLIEYPEFDMEDMSLPYEAWPLAGNDFIMGLDDIIGREVDFPGKEPGHRVVCRGRLE